MGIGDEIMASGQARAIAAETGKRVTIVGADGRPRWHTAWENIDYITPLGGRVSGTEIVKNGVNCRPYINYPFTAGTGLNWSGWRARDFPGTLVISASERRVAKAKTLRIRRPFYVIEPNIVPKLSNRNKDWGAHNWQIVAGRLSKVLNIYQLDGGLGTFRLAGVPQIETASFREAAAVVAESAGVITVEGGLHHAAAALEKPAVVLFGSYISPQATGYGSHLNITTSEEFCGAWQPCQHCRDAWETLKPADVVAQTVDFFKN